MTSKIYFGSVELYDPQTGTTISTPPIIFTDHDTPETLDKSRITKFIANKRGFERMIVKRLCFDTAKQIGYTARN